MESTLSKHRVEGLTDAIFAIVMTLIVLELKIPELERHAANPEIVDKLRALGPQLFAFFLTFALSGVFWFLHHISMQFLRHMTRPLIFLNLLFMMFVSLLPFSAGLLGRFLRAPIALQIYYANQFVLGTLLVIQWQYARRHDLITDQITKRDAAQMPLRLRILPLASLGALAAAFVQPESAQGLFALFAVGGRLFARIQERRHS